MITAIKIIVAIVVMLLLSYPFIPMKGSLKKFSVASFLKYNAPNNRKNIFFVVLTAAEFVIVVLIFKLLDQLTALIYSLPWVGKIISNTANNLSSQVDYVFFVVKLFIVNLLIVYAYIFAKAFVKKAIIDKAYKLEKKKIKFSILKRKKKKKVEAEEGSSESESEEKTDTQQADQEEEKLRLRRRIPSFVHSLFKDDEADNDKNEDAKKREKKEYSKLMRAFLKIFFEGDEFEFIRSWVLRSRMVLQCFIRLVEIVYLLFFTVALLSVLFPLPKVIYDILINILRFREWYVYPVISIIFLQDICNIFDTDSKEPELEEDVKLKEEKKEDHKVEGRIRALLAELKKRFDADHSLRYYPEIISADVPEYECTSVTYASALEYIRNRMQNESGHVVQSYMECLDAIYHDSNIYFPASFYSELGEYLIAYTYIRLLSGARQIFVVSDPNEKETLRTYISDRLMRMTGSSVKATWRVYTAEERLDQADVLIATPDDFIANNIVEQYPGFFEEVCNAIFIDADRLIAFDSYLCPIVAMRLQRVTEGRIRFVFLSLNLIKGFAAGSLPKFFCVDKVLSFSSAKENEAVSYVLWNKESKKHRIYNKNIQKLTCLETIIADLACRYGIDGVRLITESSLEHAERKILDMHNVEINNLYKNVVDVNYMIYSDDRCNLSAALYACTRFRGRKKSIVHILSKPYLLREYFMSKATTEDHVVRSSFIQPRVTEHAERHKLSLLRIFCDAANESGITVNEFEERMKEAIRATIECNDLISSAFCRQMLKDYDYREFKIGQLAAYLIAGLCDDDTGIKDDHDKMRATASMGHKAKDFYIIVDPVRIEKIGPAREKNIIFNRSKDVFTCLLKCNERVDLKLNGEVIGQLDTFPSRVHLEYIEGQSIIHKNAEYEIERISDDGRTVYLRRENISIKNCLDTVLLRNYVIHSLEPIEDSAVLNNSKALLEEIRVTRCKADFEGNTYGFYSLTADRQTLDFYRGVEGNPCVDTPHTRHYVNSGTIRVELKARIECNDGMRLLMSAVFNEFIRTIFPNAYHCIAICPVLQNPMEDEQAYRDGDPEQRIKALYPYIKNAGEEFVETDPHRMQFIFINDSVEDIGVLDWFYDRSARYMQEFLINIYSYLHWINLCPERQHYIYFGGENLCECFDLAGCCKLLEDYNLILSDEGQLDIETAGDEVLNEILHRCSFCHKQMESGRFFFFDKHRYICADCFNSVDSAEQLEEIYMTVKEYLAVEYPDFKFASATVKFDGVYELPLEKTLSENYYRVDYLNRTIYVEQDEPTNSIAVSILRGIIALWQADNGLSNHYSNGQLYYEELQYLRKKGENLSADWIYENLPYESRYIVDDIAAYIQNNVELDSVDEIVDDVEDLDAEQNEKATEDEIPVTDGSRTSFSYMIAKTQDIIEEEWDGEDPTDEDFSNDLYDPNQIPRFWKRYLRNMHIDDGNEEYLEDAEESLEEQYDDPAMNDDPVDTDGVIKNGEDNCAMIIRPMLDNMPPDDLPEETVVESEDKPENEPESDSTSDPVDKKKRKKEEKERLKAERKRAKEERERQKQEEWERKLNKAIEEDEIRKGIKKPAEKEESLEEPKPKKEKKKGFWFGKKKKEAAEAVEEATPSEEPEVGDPLEATPDMPVEAPVEDPGDIPVSKATEDTHEEPVGTPAKEPVEKPSEDPLDIPITKSVEEPSEDPVDNPVNDPAEEPSDEPGIVKKKKKWFSFGKNKKDADEPKEDSTEESAEDPEQETLEEPSEGNDKKKKKRPKKRWKLFGNSKLSPGEKILPHEDDEKTNPKIRLYNDLVRAAYNYSEAPIDRSGVTDNEIEIIFNYIKGDYPELFWMDYCRFTATEIWHVFRCKDANGTLDVKKINKDRAELRKAAAYFTRGITRKTDPYQALLTIYRRLILTLDYDMVALKAGAGNDPTKDDTLRSLRSALIDHKVVCAGYAVAMQYLLQSVGIVCAFVSSERDATGGHAFNMLKLGKYCYYLDATWGDMSSTEHGNGKNDIFYKYCCVPYEEFIATSSNSERLYHTPNKKLYPQLEQFHYTNHEYFRYHNAYLTSYNEGELVRIFAETALRYDPKEMGNFSVDIRCANKELAQYVQSTINLGAIVEKAKVIVAKKNKKAAKLFEGYGSYYPADETGVIKFLFANTQKRNK